MKIIDLPTSADPESDAVIALLPSGRSIPADIRDRVRAEARRLTDQLRHSHGIQEISAQLIREGRAET